MDNINEFIDASEFSALDNTYHNQTKPKSLVLTYYGRGRGSSGIKKTAGPSFVGRSESSVRGCKTKNTEVQCLNDLWDANASDFEPKPTGKGRGRRLYENCTPTGLQFDTTNAAKVSRQIEQVVGTGHRNYTLESEYHQSVFHNESYDSVGAASSASYYSANEEIVMEKSSEFEKSFPPLQ